MTEGHGSAFPEHDAFEEAPHPKANGQAHAQPDEQPASAHEPELSVEDILAAIPDMPRESLTEDLAGLLAKAGRIDPIAREKIMAEICASRADIGKRLAQAILKEAEGRARAIKQAKVLADLKAKVQAVGRATMECPALDAELTPVIQEVECLLRLAPRGDPICRSCFGRPVRVVQKPAGSLHLLTAATANGEEPRPDGKRTVKDMLQPPPPSYAIEDHTEVSLGIALERDIAVIKRTKDGAYEVRLPRPFVQGLIETDESTLPRLYGLAHTPVLTPEGELLVADGYDPRSGLFFTCGTDFAHQVRPLSLTDEAVRQAWRFLREEVFGDVLFETDQDFAALLGLLAQVCTGQLLPERPLYLVKAPIRGTGKTTLLHGVSWLALNEPAKAMPWSHDPVERNKALFAAAREGCPFVIPDNITAGSKLRCATLEAMSTSATYSDRVLGESRRETVHPPTFALTGNNITAVGELASRTIEIVLDTTMPNPENRTFRHPDFYAFVRRHRARILRALYTILLANPGYREPISLGTRFKPWHALIGFPIERAARLAGAEVDFAKRIAGREDDGEDADQLATLLGLLIKKYGANSFSMKRLLDDLRQASGPDASTTDRDWADRLRAHVNSMGKREEHLTDRQIEGRITARARTPVKMPDGRVCRLVRIRERSADKSEPARWQVVEVQG